MARAYVLDAARTPFGRYRGSLSGIRVDDLAALPLTELLCRHGPGGSGRLDPARIEDVLYGNTNGAGEENRNVARMAALLAGLPATVPGVTVNRLCASGGEALVQAARAVKADEAELLVAGGVEGMSRAPFVVPRAERAMPDRMEAVSTAAGWRLVNPRMLSAWTVPLGHAAERTALDLSITREQLDGCVLRSHRRAAAAWDAGLHDGFAFPVTAPDGEVVRRDESVRPDTDLRKLGRLDPAFSPGGPVTVGNSAPLSDGALAALVGTEAQAERLGVRPWGELVGSASTGTEPHHFALSAVPAIRALLRKLGVTAADVDLWEINETFAAVVLAVLEHLPGVDRERVNVHGGALAYGHPLGASMPRIVLDLCRHLRHRGGGLGIAAASVGVGQGLAIAVRA
ncbi:MULTISPECIES: thiolase family protein [unclassified Saccharopolyspora]|uniref:thiolase family protein n=1 Tax=unclassified Saccharopolyspora TaxID=2646250 RepID=UPI001CD75F1B|nr:MULTISPECIES: thiolase family protein [unclassified Saccharopolyspora]MCA1188726.1 thiolase family protein [Saccharopolyspora sp. 6T]MCA1192089.1 thiolase family protein [Saccharopolyspora sp. 6V]MCA1280250.1 thiolase family protein [Saccharopolyspora sp. 7B]